MLSFVDAAVRADGLSLTALGWALSGSSPKHRIKRADRFLGNPHTQRELPIWYRALASYLIGPLLRPVILLDWTQVVGELDALTATVPFMGRSLPLYSEVHPHRRYGNPKVHEKFLERLRAMLPPRCRPIIVADAGFRTPFFLACKELGFDYVIRVRGKTRFWSWRPEPVSFTLKQLFQLATARARCLGMCTPFNSACRGISSRIILAPRPRPALRRRGRRSASHNRSAREPWVLATSLESETAARIVSLYATRMQIEETFRDIKNPRFGWALSHSASRSAARYAVLLLLTSLSLVAVIFTGAASEASGAARRYQANTTSSRRVLSLFRVGRLALREPARVESSVLLQVASLHAYIEAFTPHRTRYPAHAPHDVACPHCGHGWVR